MKRPYIILIIITLLAGILPQMSSARGHDPRHDDKIIEAVAKYNAADFAGAEKILEEIIAEYPDSDAAHYYLALVAIMKDDAETAEEHLKKAVAADSGNFWYRHRLASLYAATSRPEIAIELYEKLLKDFPKKSDIYFELVELYASQKDIDKALAVLDEIETVFGVTESMAVYRFNLLQMKGSQEEAFSSLEEYNRKYSSPYVLATLGDWQMSMYNDSTALAYYNEALDIAPGYAPALLGKAEALRITRNYGEYFTVLEDFVKDPLTSSDGKNNYLMAIVQKADPRFLKLYMPKMDKVMDAALATHPSDSAITNLAAVWYYTTDRPQQAHGYFRQNVEDHPRSIANMANLVEFLMYAQMWEELSQTGREAFSLFPGEPAFLEMASVGDFNLERYDKVMEICDKVLEVAPTDSSRTLRAWSTKGDIHYRMGEPGKAYKAYDKALKINPDYVYVLNNYAYYLSVEGKKLKKAYAMSKKTVEAEPDNATYLDTFAWILYLMGKPLEAKPFFKHAMLYGGKESAVIMDHYAEVLFALKEYDLAFVYWNLAKQKNADGEIPDLDERIGRRKQEASR